VLPLDTVTAIVGIGGNHCAGLLLAPTLQHLVITGAGVRCGRSNNGDCSRDDGGAGNAQGEERAPLPGSGLTLKQLLGCTHDSGRRLRSLRYDGACWVGRPATKSAAAGIVMDSKGGSNSNVDGIVAGSLISLCAQLPEVVPELHRLALCVPRATAMGMPAQVQAPASGPAAALPAGLRHLVLTLLEDTLPFPLAHADVAPDAPEAERAAAAEIADASNAILQHRASATSGAGVLGVVMELLDAIPRAGEVMQVHLRSM
jgi:hypothetical protein